MFIACSVSIASVWEPEASVLADRSHSHRQYKAKDLICFSRGVHIAQAYSYLNAGHIANERQLTLRGTCGLDERFR